MQMASKQITNENMEDFYNHFNGKDCIFGTNTSWLNKEIDRLKAKPFLTKEESETLTRAYAELGRDTVGNKKPKTCWTYVHNNYCSHKTSITGILIWKKKNISRRKH
jgi:hypothetical protein